MTTRQADKLIDNKSRVILRSQSGEQFTAVLVSRDRWNVRTQDGGLFDRKDLEVIAYTPYKG